jgi:hypothetical protein
VRSLLELAAEMAKAAYAGLRKDRLSDMTLNEITELAGSGQLTLGEMIRLQDFQRKAMELA